MTFFRRIIGNPWAQCLLLALAIAAAYADSTPASFHFDDVFFLRDPAVLQGSWSADLGGSRYLTLQSFVLNYAVSGADPAAFHWVNLALHLLVTCLVYLLLRRLCARLRPDGGLVWLPFAVALIFAVHPLQTAAVDYASQRAAILAALFYVAAVAAFVEADGNGRRAAGWWLAALLCAVLAMKCKENSFTLPFAILLTDWLLRPGAGWRRWKALAFLPLLALIPLSHLDVMQEGTAALTRQTADISRLDYLLTESHVLLTYLRLSLLPLGQNLDHDYPISHGLDLATLVILALHAAALAAALACLAKGRDPLLRLAAYGVVWFYLTLAVESSLLPIRDVINEYRLYLPCLGLWLAAGCLLTLATAHLPSPAWRRALRIAPAAVAALGFASLTYARNPVWHDEVSLWSDVVQKAPHKARGHNDLGVAYLGTARPDLAVQQFKLAVAEEPTAPDDQVNLAQAYAAAGDAGSAIATLQRVIHDFPQHAGAHAQLGDLYAAAGELPQALDEFRAAVRLVPDSVPFRDNLALTERAAGQPAEALRDLSQVLALDPQDPAALFQYGELSLQADHLDDACHAFLADLPLQPDDPRVLYYGARCKLRAGDRAGAIQMLQDLESRFPGATPAASLLQQLR